MLKMGALEMVVDHSEGELKAADRARVVRAVMARIEARVKKFTMDSPLL
jgi:hypothetical protein